ncbi:MAG: nitrate reductase [Herpetosiphon sp.]
MKEHLLLATSPAPTVGQAICPYCGVGCLVDVTVKAGKVTAVRGAPESPVNRGLLCPKGALLDRILDLPGRLTTPLIRANRNEPFQAVDWPTALAEIARRMRTILQREGPGALALYGSGQLDTEAWYLANKLFKGYLVSNHVDSNSRLCMASAVAAYRLSLGSDGPPTCFDDINHADLFFIVGSNMVDAHPVAWGRVKARRREGGPGMIVVDPRRTHTAHAADIHVPLRPGTDIAFFNALGRIILDRQAADEAFIGDCTSGFADYAALLMALDLKATAETCGLALSQIEEVAERLINARSLLSLYSMGLNQSTVGVWKNNALINLHLLLGQIGKPGSGPFSLTGQPNAMGGRELGGLAHLLPGYRLIENPTHRAEVEAAWGLAPGTINPQPGLTAVEQFQALEQGRLKATWIVCNNPAVSMPDLAQVRRGLAQAELVIVQDAFETETTAFADIILPAAQWIEKTGTSTNSERRVTRSEQLVEPPGLARADWWIFDQVSQALGFPGVGGSGVDAVWDEYRRLTGETACDQNGMTIERLQEGPLQWPCPTTDHPGTERRYTDHRFALPDGRARFWARPHQAPHEAPDRDFPLELTTGRIAGQWHTMTRTGKISQLRRNADAAFIELHHQDAAPRGVADGDLVVVESRRGRIEVRAVVNDRVRPGSVFMPFHWGSLQGGHVAANELTSNAVDPISKEPEYKFCAVRIERAVPIPMGIGVATV